jgi:putative iron-dependent peroxidase
MDDAVKAPDAHIALNVIEDADGRQLQVMRLNMPFGAVGTREFGTYFIGYAASADVLERMLSNMFLGTTQAPHDRILDFSTAVTGNLFFAPTVDLLENPPRPAAPPATPADPDPRSDDSSLRIGSLRDSASE